MQVTMAHIHVKAEYIVDFIKVCGLNYAASVQESGNVRFDVLPLPGSSRVVLSSDGPYATASEVHKGTAHIGPGAARWPTGWPSPASGSHILSYYKGINDYVAEFFHCPFATD